MIRHGTPSKNINFLFCNFSGCLDKSRLFAATPCKLLYWVVNSSEKNRLVTTRRFDQYALSIFRRMGLKCFVWTCKINFHVKFVPIFNEDWEKPVKKVDSSAICCGNILLMKPTRGCVMQHVGGAPHSEVWFDKPGSPFGLEDKAPPEPPGCLILEDLQTLHIPTNKKLEVWTQYRLPLSFLGDYFSSFKKILRQRKICKKILKSGKILRNHRATH